MAVRGAGAHQPSAAPGEVGGYWEEVLSAAESFYDATWSGNAPLPGELVDYELMREMGWSWPELDATPVYVRRYCLDLMNIRRRNEAQRAKSGR